MIPGEAVSEVTDAMGEALGALPCFRGQPGLLLFLKFDALLPLALNRFFSSGGEFFGVGSSAVVRVFDVTPEHFRLAAGVVGLSLVHGVQDFLIAMARANVCGLLPGLTGNGVDLTPVIDGNEAIAVAACHRIAACFERGG